MSMIKVEKKLNKSTLTVDGQVSSPMLYGLSDFPAAASFTAQAQRNIKAFRKAGIKIVNVDSGLHHGWFKHDPFDPEPVVAEIANALEAAPDIKVMVRLHMNPPYWWLRDHPEECIVYRSPEGDYTGIDNGEQEALDKAIAERDVQAIFSIFAADPLVTCSYEDAKKLFKEMVDNTKEYLGGYDFSVLD